MVIDQATQTVWRGDYKPPEERDCLEKGIGAAMVGIAPRDEIEGMLAAQIVGVQNAVMECLRRGMGPHEQDDIRLDFLKQVPRLGQTFTKLLEALNKHRGKAPQQIKVEHVHINEGGQAIVGAANQSAEPPRKPARKSETATPLPYKPEEPIAFLELKGEPVPVHARPHEEVSAGAGSPCTASPSEDQQTPGATNIVEFGQRRRSAQRSQAQNPLRCAATRVKARSRK